MWHRQAGWAEGARSGMNKGQDSTGARRAGAGGLAAPDRHLRDREETGTGGERSGASNSGQHVPHRVTVGDHRRQHPGEVVGGAVDRVPQRGLDRAGRPDLAAHVDPARPGPDRPAPGHRLPHVLALGADPDVTGAVAAAQPDLAVVQQRRALAGSARTRNLAATWCGVSIRVPSYLLLIWNRPYPSDPTAPIHT